MTPHISKSNSYIIDTRNTIHYHHIKWRDRSRQLYRLWQFTPPWKRRSCITSLVFSPKLYLSQFKKSSSILSSPQPYHISLEDTTNYFERWKESTISSPSTRDLVHYKSFLVSDGRDDDLDHSSSINHMLQTINILFCESIEAGTPLKRWLSSTMVMIINFPTFLE